MNEEVELLHERLFHYFLSCGLSRFGSTCAVEYLKKHIQQENGDVIMRRVMLFLLRQLNNIHTPPSSIHSYQLGCPNLLEGLESKPFWDSDQFVWAKKIEDSYLLIRNEFKCLQGSSSFHGFQPYRAPSGTSSNKFNPHEDHIGEEAVMKGSWNVCYLYLHGIDFSSNREHFPITTHLIDSIGSHYHHALVSALAPDSHIAAHHGPTNRKLRCQLPLIVPTTLGSESKLRVGDQWRTLEEGKLIIFDDSFEHEALHASLQPRVVLIFDIWHPDFTKEEIKFLEYLNKYEMRALQELQSRKTETSTEDNNFLTVIERGKSEQARASVSPLQIWG